MRELERWLAEGVPGFDPGAEWYVGRPLLVTENDYGLKLFNGDTGVVIAVGDDRVEAAFERSGETVTFSPTRLGAVDTVYAMTIHKSQGSQFGTVAVVLPDARSGMLTRELLYTAVTRAQERCVVVGDEAAVRAAVGRSTGRASGLAGRLGDV
jgi:exodeoxyribonuclease V alpha subunit